MIAASLLASTSRNAGGLFESVRRLHQELLILPGFTVPVFGLEDRFTDEDKPRWEPLTVTSSAVRGPRAFGYAPELCSNLLAADLDLMQVHGIWQYPSVAALRWHRRTGKPYIVSPHGMLDPWALGNAGWKKKIAGFCYERRHLQKAACLRALCGSEAESMRQYGLKNPICIIPNGVDSAAPSESGASESSALPAPGPKLLLSLGRLHPKKGLPNALRAWKDAASARAGSGIDAGTWQLVIAGWDQGGHEAELQHLCRDLGLVYDTISAADFVKPRGGSAAGASVVFTGPAFGESKTKLFERASAFMLPSFSEGLPMAVLEAWSFGVPVVMTEFCNLPEGFAAGAALRTGTETTAIAASLCGLFAMTDAQRRQMGANGLELVKKQFSWPNVARQMKEVYDWVLGGGPVPSTVILHE